MKRAVNLLRRNPTYRREVFDEGFKRNGFNVVSTPIGDPDPDDALIIWNRYGASATQADLFEKVGAPVFVVENGYVDMKDTKKTFAISLSHHLGGGYWPCPEHSRFDLLAITLKSWRTRGKTTLVLPQRGIGHKAVAMPKNWADKVTAKIHPIATRKIYVRKHPELIPERLRVPLEQDLEKAWCAVTWASSAAIKAMIAGIPVFYEFDKWIAGSCAIHGFKAINHVEPVELMGDRKRMLEALAWAQWSTEEVYEGTAIKLYLDRHKEVNA